ncbi:MAG: FAD-binding oxidoreductase [Pseudanabaena sp. ELA607]
MPQWTALAQKLAPQFAGLELIHDLPQVTKLSEDYFRFSPILTTQLSGKVADLVVRPTDESGVIQVARVCVAEKVPLTVRGSGTGNYGQCVPMAGGVVLDMSRYQGIEWLKPGLARVAAGTKIAMIDQQAQAIGWETRMAPSTLRSATIGGFITGGSGGIGSLLYGQLADRGNVRAARIVTLEDEPQIIELRGYEEISQINHAYGVNGIITSLEIPLAPAYPWAEYAVTFADFMTAVRFGIELGKCDGIITKMISIHGDPIPQFFSALKSHLPAHHHCVLVIAAESDYEPMAELVTLFGGTITYEKSSQEAGKGISLVEFSWNHTTLHARLADGNFTYLQSIFSNDPDLQTLAHLHEHFGDEILPHLELVKVHGQVTLLGLQLVRYTTEARLNEIIAYHEAQGVMIANPHTYILEDGGRKVTDPAQLAFKQKVDPYGLLNPQKMRGWRNIVI